LSSVTSPASRREEIKKVCIILEFFYI
jgi:hypothetical protein